MWKSIKEFFGFFDKPEVVMPKDTRREDITDLYKTILGREPDKDGLDWWVNSQATLDEIRVEFMKSEEYLAKITPAPEPVVEVEPEPKIETKVEPKPAAKPAAKSTPKPAAKGRPKKTK